MMHVHPAGRALMGGKGMLTATPLTPSSTLKTSSRLSLFQLEVVADCQQGGTLPRRLRQHLRVTVSVCERHATGAEERGLGE